MAQTKNDLQQVRDLENDKVFLDLVTFAQDTVGRATHDALLRFRWGKYEYNAAVAALSYVLAHVIAVLNRSINITPEEVAEIVKDAVIKVRCMHPYEDDDEN